MIQSRNHCLGLNFLMLDRNSIVECIAFQARASNYALEIYRSLDRSKQFSACSVLYFIFQELQTGIFYAVLDLNRTNINLQDFFKSLTGLRYHTMQSRKLSISQIFEFMASINFRQLYIFQRLKGIKQKQAMKTKNPFERAIMEQNLARISTLQEEEKYLQMRNQIEDTIQQKQQIKNQAFKLKKQQVQRQKYLFGQNSLQYQIHMKKEYIESYQSRIEQEQSQNIGKVIINGQEDIWDEKEVFYKKTANRDVNLQRKKRKMY